MVHINHSQQPHRRSLYNQSVSHFGPKELLMAVYSPPFMIGIRGGGVISSHSYVHGHATLVSIWTSGMKTVAYFPLVFTY